MYMVMHMVKKYKTQRACKQCGKIFYGNMDCLLCPECAKESRIKNVVRDRICIDCGTTFQGGPRARRCPDCRQAAKNQTVKPFKKNSAKRPIGSMDICQVCGHEYTVISGRQKYCSGACQRVAVLEWQRKRKQEYNKNPAVTQARKVRRAGKQKVCVYCLRVFSSTTSSNVCSDYCRAKRQQLNQCIADIKRGEKRDMQKLLDAQQEYQDCVKKEKKAPV